MGALGSFLLPFLLQVAVLTCSVVILFFLMSCQKTRRGSHKNRQNMADTLQENRQSMTEKSKSNINPEDLRLYSLALHNRWPKRELHHHIAPYVPIFVYNSLMLPWVLARVLGMSSRGTAGIEETATYVTRATLRHHFRVVVRADQSPTIVKTKEDAAVDGMLIAGLRPDAAEKIQEYIGLSHHKKNLEEVEIVAREGDQITVCAFVYVWKEDRKLLEAKNWSPMDYMRSRVPDLDASLSKLTQE